MGELHRIRFRREGLARRYLKINGRWQDHVLLAVTLEDREGPPDPASLCAP